MFLYYQEDFEQETSFGLSALEDGGFVQWQGDPIQLDFALNPSPTGSGNALRYNGADAPLELLLSGYGPVLMKTDIYFEAGAASFVFYDHSGGKYRATLGTDNLVSLYKNDTLLTTASVNLTPLSWHSWTVSFYDGIFAVSVDNSEIVQADTQTNSFFKACCFRRMNR
jgi:hypothetical protein